MRWKLRTKEKWTSREEDNGAWFETTPLVWRRATEASGTGGGGGVKMCMVMGPIMKQPEASLNQLYLL